MNLHSTRGETIRPPECPLCGGSGIVPLQGRPPRVPFEDIWQWQAPCGCRAGDEWRKEARLCLSPPPCEVCGRLAEVTLTTYPRCILCDRERRCS